MTGAQAILQEFCRTGDARHHRELRQRLIAATEPLRALLTRLELAQPFRILINPATEESSTELLWSDSAAAARDRLLRAIATAERRVLESFEFLSA